MKDFARLLLSFFVVLFSLIFSRPAFSQDGSPNGMCSFRTLHLPVNSAGFDTVEAINDIGAIVGSIADANEQLSHGFLLFNGKFTSFKFPGSVVTAVHDI